MNGSSPSTAPPWWFLVLLPLAAFALVFTAFTPALEGKFLQWDDVQGIAQNDKLRQGGWDGIAWRFTTTHMGHYQPLAWWSLSLDVAGEPQGELGDAAAARCHRTNLSLHALCAVALGLLGERLLRLVVRGWKKPPSAHAAAAAALFGSLAWAVHPLRTESVAWITERRDVLSGAPLFLSIYMYVLWAEGRGLPGSGEQEPARGRRNFLVASFGLLLVSLLAKAWGIVVPAVLVALDFYPLRRGPVSRRAILALALEKAPFIALSIVFAVVAAWAQASQPDAMPSFADHDAIERVLQAASGLFSYVFHSLAPMDLSPLYELPATLSIADPQFYWPLLVVAIAVTLLVKARDRLPGLVTAAVVFALFVAPVLGFAQAGPQLAADRYTYLAGGAVSLVAAGALLAWSTAARELAAMLGCVVIALLVPLSRAQSLIWHDNETLWTHVVELDPSSLVGNLSLGNEFVRRAAAAPTREQALELLREAERHFVHGLDAHDDPRFASKLALLHRSLAELEPERAEEHLWLAQQLSQRAVKLAIATGRVSPEARLEHALRLLAAGKVDEAQVELEWYVSQRPDDPRAKAALEEARARAGH